MDRVVVARVVSRLAAHPETVGSAGLSGEAHFEIVRRIRQRRVEARGARVWIVEALSASGAGIADGGPTSDAHERFRCIEDNVSRAQRWKWRRHCGDIAVAGIPAVVNARTR